MQLLNLWNSIQDYLFPVIEEGLGEELSKKEQEFVRVCTLCELDHYLDGLLWEGVGRRSKDRLSILKAFVAKAVYNFSTTRQLIDYLQSCPQLRRLCGWERKSDIPHESKFSRVFDRASHLELPQRIHENLVTKHLGERIIGHVSRDSTAIHAREKVQRIESAMPEEKESFKRGRPKKGEVRPPKQKTRLQLQGDRSLEENLKDLPQHCNKGTKKNSNGYKVSWKGYKLHLDCIDGDIPVSAVLSSASLHDSQVAIPLAQLTDQRVDSLYDLMDAAYDAQPIRDFSIGLGHVPIIDFNRKGKEKRELDTAKKVRYRERSTAERVNSNLKDNYGGNNLRVRGHDKVMCHLMFGLLALTANQLFNMLN